MLALAHPTGTVPRARARNTRPELASAAQSRPAQPAGLRSRGCGARGGSALARAILYGVLLGLAPSLIGVIDGDSPLTRSARAANLEDSSHALLTLASEDLAAAAALSDAIRGQLSEMGVGNSSKMSLGEIRLTMGCAESDFGCLAKGGRAIQADHLIFGRLDHIEDGLSTTLQVLDTQGAHVLASQEFTMAYEALAAENIDAAAKRIIEVLFNPDLISSAAIDLGDGQPQVAHSGSSSSESAEAKPKRRERRAKHRRPKLTTPGTMSGGRRGRGPGGKERGSGGPPGSYHLGGLAAGFGVSSALAVGGIVTAIVLEHQLSKKGDLYNDLIDAALASITDDDPNNDVSPYTDENLCDLARAPSVSGETNPEMSTICNRADRLGLARTLTWISAGTMTITSAVLLGVLVKQKRRRALASALIRHRPGMSLVAGREGVRIGLGFRF